MSARGKSRVVAANKISSAGEHQTQEEQTFQNTGLNVGKSADRSKTLLHKKHTSLGVKRKAESNNHDKVKETKLRHLSNTILPKNIESYSMQKYSYLLDLKAHDFSRVIKVLKYQHFSQDHLDRALILACQSLYKNIVENMVEELKIVEKLINRGANVDCRDSDGNTPLIISSKKPFVELVQLLLTKEADVNAVNSAGNTALILSIQPFESKDTTTLLLQQEEIDIGHQNKQGYTALMKAVEEGEFSTAKILLELQFQKCSKMPDPWWELHNSAFKNYKGETTLDMFKKYGHAWTYKTLIESIQDKTWYEQGKVTPLSSAVKDCDVKLLDAVLDTCDLDDKAKAKMVSRAYSNFFQHDFSQITESPIPVVKRLLELGADVNGGPSVFPLCVATKAGSYPLVELLCQHGADCNKADRMFGGSPPLSIAAEEGRCDLVELLLRFGANIHDSELHDSVIDQVLIRGHMDCAKLLVQNGAEVNIKSALHNVIQKQNMNSMNFLLENCKHETHQYILENKHTLLKSAVREADVEIVSHILDIGFDTTGEHPCWEKLLVESGNVEIARFLIQNGADVNKMIATTCGSYTPLYLAIRRGDICRSSQLQVVRALLENGASPNIHGDTSPLMLAASTNVFSNGNAYLLKLLLDYGADINCTAKNGDTPFYKKGDTAFFCSTRLGLQHNVECMMKYAKDKDFLNIQNIGGLNSLMEIVRLRNVAIVTEVIKYIRDLNVTDMYGNTALLHAVDIITDYPNNDINCIVAALVKAGSDVNWQNNDGLSPLMLATNRYNVGVIKILIDARADVNAVSKTDRTKTALSYLQPTSCISNKDVAACLSHFLSRGARLSYLQPKMFHRILLCNNTDIISKVIAHVQRPISVRSDKYFNFARHGGRIFDVSPLCTALFDGQTSLARHFIDIMFLTKSDVSPQYIKNIYACCKIRGTEQLLELLDEMFSQPMSLFRLSFVTVSSAVGTSPGRENRVNKLPLSWILKDKLLFKSPGDLTLTEYMSSRLFSFPTDPKNYIYLHDGCKCCTYRHYLSLPELEYL